VDVLYVRAWLAPMYLYHAFALSAPCFVLKVAMYITNVFLLPDLICLNLPFFFLSSNPPKRLTKMFTILYHLRFSRISSARLRAFIFVCAYPISLPPLEITQILPDLRMVTRGVCFRAMFSERLLDYIILLLRRARLSFSAFIWTQISFWASCGRCLKKIYKIIFFS